MKFCYQVATPDVAISPAVTAFQGKLVDSLDYLADLGYDGVEFMTLNAPGLDQDAIKRELDRRGLIVSLVCTGEIFGQLGVSYMDPDPEIRREAVRRSKEIIDFAALLDTNINIGRVHGMFRHDVSREVSYGWAVDSLRELCDHAGPKGVQVALENVTIMQTNFINTLAEAAEVVRDVARDNCKIMIDVFHLNIEERDMYQAIRDYNDYNIHVHLSDNNRRYPGNCGLDFEKILRTFKEVGYDGTYTTEIFQLPDQEAAATGSIRHLAPLFAKVYGR
ncbi:MAG: sugar phosphate isomerase/epimerase [Planctomycetes bacterium]|nr:sugar phosphate isomerase/epimerase [Planctomycetota bacterium]